MKRLLSNEKRASLEARLKELRQTVANLTTDSVSDIVDKVSPDDSDIKGVVTKITSIMESSEKTASKEKQIVNILKQAFIAAHEKDETPAEEGKDLASPVMHPFEDAEHEAQTLDDPSLMAEIEKVENHVKNILDRHDPLRHDDSLHSEEAPMKEHKTALLSSEQKLALLMSLPKDHRLAKAANLRALAGVLEGDATEVSQDNCMTDQPNGEMLAHDFEDEELGSMKDVQHTANLQKGIKTILAAMEEMDKTDDEKTDDEKNEEDKKDDSSKGKDIDQKAILKLALKHLEASVEDMMKAREEDDKNNDGKKDGGANDKDEKDGGMPNWLQEKFEAKNDKKEEDKKDDKKDDWEEKKARLKNRIAGFKKEANAEMETPPEVQKATSTVEDELHGKNKIQYSTNSGADSPDKIYDNRTNKEASVEGNADYSSPKPEDHYKAVGPEGESESLEGGERTLKDEENAVFLAQPISPDEYSEKGEGTHTKTLDWDTEKEKADMTPHDRLTGLASIKEIIKERTVRAAKLAGKMVSLGLIRTEAQMAEEISTLAQLDDTEFATIASFVGGKLITAAKTEEDADEIPEKEKSPVVEHDDKDEDDDDEKDLHKEARSVRRAASSRQVPREAASMGLKKPLFLESAAQDTSRTSGIANKIAAAARWTSPLTLAEEKASLLDSQYSGGHIDMENFLQK